jgi:hypothetical protein
MRDNEDVDSSGASSEIGILSDSDFVMAVSDEGNSKIGVTLTEVGNSGACSSDAESLKSDDCVKTSEGTPNISDADIAPESSNFVEAEWATESVKSADFESFPVGGYN